MKTRGFEGAYDAKDFADYCFAFDDGGEGSLPWDESMHKAYEALREHVESSFAETPWPAFLLGCEARFGVGEEFFAELFSPKLGCYSSEVFFGDGAVLLDTAAGKKALELISKTRVFDKAVADGKARFFSWFANGMRRLRRARARRAEAAQGLFREGAEARFGAYAALNPATASETQLSAPGNSRS